MHTYLYLLLAGMLFALGTGPAAAVVAAEEDDAASELAELELERLNAIIEALEVLQAKGDVAAMLELYAKGLLLSPTDVSARERYASIGLNLFGYALAGKGDPAAMLPLLDQYKDYVGDDFPLPSALLWLRVAALHRLNKADEAAAVQQQAAEFKPDDPDYHRQVGNYLLRSGLYGEAIAEFEAALARAEDAWYKALFTRSIAAAYLMMEQYDKAADEFEKAVATYREGQFPRAYADLLEDAAYAMYHLGRESELRGKYKEAIAANERALKLMPEVLDDDLGAIAATNLTAIADAYVKLNKPKEAVEYAERAKQGAPDSPGVYSSLGDAYAAAGKKDEAEAAYTECERLYRAMMDADPDRAMGYNNLAWFYVTHDRQLEEALKLSRTAVELAPQTDAYIDTLAEIYFRQGEYDKALETIATVFELDPKPRHILYFEQQRDKFEKAKKRGH